MRPVGVASRSVLDAYLVITARPQPTWRAFATTLLALLLLASGTGQPAQAQTFSVLYSFAGYPTDGAGPGGALLMDASGNLYGTTSYGGNVNLSYCGSSGYSGCGTVFMLDPNGVETVLHNFNGADGANPSAGLIRDGNGDLYGTTVFGGRLQDCTGNGSAGCGVVFQLSGRKETVLHRFCSVGSCADGAEPLGDSSWMRVVHCTAQPISAGLTGPELCSNWLERKKPYCIASGALPMGVSPKQPCSWTRRGTSTAPRMAAGDMNCDYPYACGVVFKLAGKKETILHAFKGIHSGPHDGAFPEAALTMDAEGNLYGTTNEGGNNYNMGTVFEVSADGKEHVLYKFGPPLGHAGARPVAGVIRDAEGNLYGTTPEGGKFGVGIVFEIGKDGKEKVLHTFCSAENCTDGFYSYGDLIMDAEGNLYGTTSAGGASRSGTIYKITLHSPNAP